jgi:hypothetical protein
VSRSRVDDADVALRARLDAVCEDGWAFWESFDCAARRRAFHPFVPADYDAVRAALLRLPATGQRFLEWGAAAGVIAIMADVIGFDACGIELDAALVAAARALALRHDSRARFVVGSFLPTGYRWRSSDGDTRTGTIGQGDSGYLQLGRALDEFDVVFGYPWDGESRIMQDVMRRYGRPGALLLLYDASAGVRGYRDGREMTGGL